MNWIRVGDFNFHFEKASGDCQTNYDESQCASYYPLLHNIGSFFSFSPHAFNNFLMIIILFITPLILFFITRHWISVVIYFSIQYVYAIQAGGAYPQAIAGILLLLFLWTKNPIVKFVLIIIGMISHSQAFVLLLLVWVIELLFENTKHIKSFFPACSAFFGKQDVDPISAQISVEVLNRNGIQLIWIELKNIANFFVRMFPLPFLLMALWQIKKEKSWVTLALVGFFFYYGFAIGNPRIYWMIPLVLIPFVSRFYEPLQKKWKIGFLALIAVTFLLNFGSWSLYKVQCLA